MVTWLIRSVLLILLFVAIRSFLRRLLAPLARTAQKNPARSPSSRTIRGKTVRDPQCGMYVATDLAIAAKRSTETLYFCSEDCRDTYFSRQHAEVS